MTTKIHTERLLAECAKLKAQDPDEDARAIANEVMIHADNEAMLGLVAENEEILDTDMATLECEFDCLADVIECCCRQWLLDHI